MMPKFRDKAGFTLIEALLAAGILALAVLWIIAGVTRALGGTRLNRQREVAASLLDRQLSMIDYIGIEEFVELGQMEGEFEEFEGRYRWKVVTEAQDIGLLYKVNITVSWVEGNRPYSVSVDTMLNGRGLVETEETI